VSPLRDRVIPVFHASRLTVQDMINVLTNYFHLEDRTIDELRQLLRGVCGRPYFFFNRVFSAIWKMLESGWGKKNSEGIGADRWHNCLLDAVKSGIELARGWMRQVVEKNWDTPVAPPDNSTSSSLCSELYAAIRLNNGQVHFRVSEAMAFAIRCGLLALPIVGADSNSPLKYSMNDEPISMNALRAHGDTLVCRKDPDEDPIFGLLAKTLGSGEISMFGFTQSVKGNVLELAFVWHVVRVGLVAEFEGKPATLHDLLYPLLPRSGRVHNYVPVSAQARHLASTTPVKDAIEQAGATAFRRVLQYPSAVVFAVDRNAGVDVLLATESDPGNDVSASFVLVQAKAQQRAQLVDCLRAASPAWQYTTDPERHDVIAGNISANHKWSKRRLDFVKLAGEHPDAFNSAIRVALSVNDFQSNAVTMCQELNRCKEGTYDSPIVLCVATSEAFGARLCRELQAVCQGPSLTSLTTSAAYLLPHTVAAVQSGQLNLNAVPDRVHAILQRYAQ